MNIDKLQTITICPVSAIFPDDWRDWIFDVLAMDAPFSWGDNTHTLVEADTFKDHLTSTLLFQDVPENDVNEHKDSILNVLKKLEDLEVLIDLEN